MTADAHAVVLGASMTGLFATRVLSGHFRRVTLIERDVLPDEVAQRRGVPQGRHLHALLDRGQHVLTQFFPGLAEELAAVGGERIDLPGDVRWFHCGGYKPSFRSGVTLTSVSRPTLESIVRYRIRTLPNVTVMDDCVAEELTATEDRRRVTGVRVRAPANGGSEPISLEANLVVDARGRGCRAPAWLEALGYERPAETVVKIGIGYVTRLYRQAPQALPNVKAAFCMPAPPQLKRGAALMPIEGGRWIVTTAGWLGDHAPTDDAGFLEYVASLAAPDIHNALRAAEPLSDFETHKFPSNLRRHYERLTRFPDGYLVMGDAIASFNPVYGQGMTVSACEARALDQALAALPPSRGMPGLATRFFREAAAFVDVAWGLSTGEDFRFPEVEGPRPVGTGFIGWYTDRMHRASQSDHDVTRAFFQVMTLSSPPTLLFSPRLMWRIARLGGRRAAPAAALSGTAAG